MERKLISIISIVGIILICSLVVAVSTVEEEIIQPEVVKSKNVVSSVYVNLPNFDVLDETKESVFTVIKDASIPETYQGTLLRLKSDDVSDVVMAAGNLGIKKIVVYSKDKALLSALELSGITLELKE